MASRWQLSPPGPQVRIPGLSERTGQTGKAKAESGKVSPGHSGPHTEIEREDGQIPGEDAQGLMDKPAAGRCVDFPPGNPAPAGHRRGPVAPGISTPPGLRPRLEL